MILLNKLVYLNEYQQDDLTANYKSLLTKNSNKAAHMYYIYLISTRKQINRMMYL